MAKEQINTGRDFSTIQPEKGKKCASVEGVALETNQRSSTFDFFPSGSRRAMRHLIWEAAIANGLPDR